MTSPSPSEFLTFARYMRPTQFYSRYVQGPQRQKALASFSSSSSASLSSAFRRSYAHDARDMGRGKAHLLEKDNHYDVQASASKLAKEERERASNRQSDDSAASQATSQRDHGHFNRSAKQKYPEAREPIIGMNDERGGKGH